MKTLKRVGWIVLLILGGSMLAAAADLKETISGNYVETRSAEVFAGPCMANSEMNLVGDEAILAWHVSQGSWQGVPLDGLGVAAAVKAHGTIGAPDSDPYPAKAVLLLDERANSAQREALESFARARAGKLLDEVVITASAPMHFEERAHGSVLFTAGDNLRVETRPMQEGDHLCHGNEGLCYLPLTHLSHSMPTFTLMERYTGKGLGATWSISGKSSSFVGSF
jgi:hypothetical protein